MADYRVKTECRLADYLTGLGHSWTKVKQLMRHRAVEVNGKRVRGGDHQLRKGDRVSVSKGRKAEKAAPALGVSIVFEDNDILVVEKPAGLLTIASEKEKTKTAYYQLNEFLKMRSTQLRERVYIVHRLDRDTSGLIVFAKNEKGKRALQDGWSEVEKRYYALVEGTPARKEDTLRSRLSQTKSLKVYIDRHSAGAKLSETGYRVLRSGNGYSLLDVHLKTGRKNQIRVHLSDIGHPVAGDRKYGAKTNPLRRLGLHSCRLIFKHPVTGQLLRFESKAPSVFSKMLSRPA